MLNNGPRFTPTYLGFLLQRSREPAQIRDIVENHPEAIHALGYNALGPCVDYAAMAGKMELLSFLLPRLDTTVDEDKQIIKDLFLKMCTYGRLTQFNLLMTHHRDVITKDDIGQGLVNVIQHYLLPYHWNDMSVVYANRVEMVQMLLPLIDNKQNIRELAEALLLREIITQPEMQARFADRLKEFKEEDDPRDLIRSIDVAELEEYGIVGRLLKTVIEGMDVEPEATSAGKPIVPQFEGSSGGGAKCSIPASDTIGREVVTAIIPPRTGL